MKFKLIIYARLNNLTLNNFVYFVKDIIHMLMFHLGDFSSIRFWIAATDLGSENDFYWESTGDLIGPYTNWALNEPNNDKDNEHCVVLASSGVAGAWNDVPCTLNYRYICKMSRA
jgi:Lectin C-type domain